MTELQEVAEAIFRGNDVRPDRRDAVKQLVLSQMPDETDAVIDGVTDALWRLYQKELSK
ncbi:hypothetical protein D9M70_403450 [compost metagenome]